ncbi:hypothetical protein ACFSHR_11120 [Azotobacter chroococcum]
MILEGALDLSLDLGLGPDPTHPQVWEALQSMAAACAAAGVPFCANPRTPNRSATGAARASGASSPAKTAACCSPR